MLFHVDSIYFVLHLAICFVPMDWYLVRWRWRNYFNPASFMLLGITTVLFVSVYLMHIFSGLWGFRLIVHNKIASNFFPVESFSVLNLEHKVLIWKSWI